MPLPSRSTTFRRRAGRLLALGGAVVLAAGACGSSKSSSSSGAPIKVMLAGTISSQAFSFPETVSGAQAAIAALNSSGGLNGHKIETVSCNDQLDPNVAAQCGRQAVSDQVSAVIEVETDYAPEMLQSLTPAHIPLLGNLPGNPVELTSSNVFTLGGGSYALFSGLGTAMVKVGHCQKTAVVVLNLAATELSGRNIRTAVELAGGKVTGIQAVSPTLPSYASVVTTAIDQGADCIANVLGPAQVTALVEAMHTSSKPNMILGSAAGDITPQGFQSMRNSLTGDIFSSVQYLEPSADTSGHPAGVLSAFESDMKKYEPNALVDSESLAGWQAMTIFIHAARTVSHYDAATMLGALSKVHGLQLSGMPVPVSYDTPNPNPKMARVTDPYVITYQIENGDYHLLPGKIDISKPLGQFLNQG